MTHRHIHHFNSSLQLTSTIHRYCHQSPHQLTATLIFRIHHYSLLFNSPLQLTTSTYRYNSPLRFTTTLTSSTHCHNSPLQFTATLTSTITAYSSLQLSATTQLHTVKLTFSTHHHNSSPQFSATLTSSWQWANINISSSGNYCNHTRLP
jgi:hypothetical protein